MTSRAKHYIQTRSKPGGHRASPVDVTVNTRSHDRARELAEQGWALVSEPAAMIANYTKTPTKVAPGLTKVQLDGKLNDAGSVYVPAWAHAFFAERGTRDDVANDLKALREDRRSQILLVSIALLSKSMPELERLAYRVCLEKLQKETDTT